MTPVPSVSGTVIRANRTAFGTLLGEDRVRSVFASNPRYRFWEEVTNVEWLELNLVEESVRALADAVGRDAVAINVAATRLGTEASFRTIWKVLLRFTSDEALVQRSSTLYARAFNVGRIEYEPGPPGRANLWIADWHEPPPFHMEGLASGIETMLRLAGRLDARVRYETERGRAVFRSSARAHLAG